MNSRQQAVDCPNLSTFVERLTSIRGSFLLASIFQPAVCFFSLLLQLQSGFAQTNLIVLENALTGSPPSQWQISGAGDTNIQGFATQISVNKGEIVHFKINTSALAYRADIYRLGYYQGNGARLVASISPSVSPPQIQPAPITDATTGLIDYGNWAESATWAVPVDAVSGIYIAKLLRTDTNGASHIIFVVRDDSGASDLLFKTSDTTWQAYNDYGGNSLYVGMPVGRAYKVSYNRPFNTPADSAVNWVFNAEYPMLRWLEANGYNVSYITSLDTDFRGGLLLQHKAFLSVGHDEYWSAGERTNVEAAVNAGVHLAFFSGNEVFWKTRWESSIDGSSTPYRTLVCYKETRANAKIDPSPFWTGTWRDPRFSPPSDGGRPENKLTGTLFMVNGPSSGSIQVPAAYGAHRFWRNTTVATLAPGATAVFPLGTLGFEWDTSPDNGFRPAGLMQLSSSTLNQLPVLLDYGTTYSYGSNRPTGMATHNLCLYRHTSRALVFGAGTVQWSWGLDSNAYNAFSPTSLPMRQATVNLLADMGIQPGNLQTDLIPGTPSTDLVPPTSTILIPAPGTTGLLGNPLLIGGTANDTGGRVWGVEISTDAGTNWHPAAGWTNWSYFWTPTQPGPATVLSRAVDDSGNLESPGAGVTVVVPLTQVSIWPFTAVPGTLDNGRDNPVELGVKFRSDVAGTIIGIRFYKANLNTGVHVGNLWDSAGTLLASVTFTNESISGWQQANFASPIPIADHTIYVASYHSAIGHYSADRNYFAAAGVDNPPLHALANSVSTPDGVYAYGSSSTFPNQSSTAVNYWVDVAFTTNKPPVLAAIANQSIALGMTLNVTNAASDAESPPEVLTFGLGMGAPTNASINPATGLFIWAPTAGQLGTNIFSVVVTDNGLPPLSTMQSIAVVVMPSNQPPVLAAISNQMLAIGMTLTITNIATDADNPPEVLTFSLGLGTPANASINPTTGVFTWTPTPMQVGTNTFSVMVADNGLPPLSTTQSFAVVVMPSNNPPVLGAISNQMLTVGMTLTITNIATDPDSPPEMLTFSLGAGAVTNASIDASTGVFIWTPSATQLGTNIFSVMVTDNGLPPLSATQSFAAIVSPLTIGSVVLTNGLVTITWNAIAGRSYHVQERESIGGTNWQNLATNSVAIGPVASWSEPVGSNLVRFYRIQLVP